MRAVAMSTRATITESLRVEHFPRGECVTSFRPGDVILVSGTSWRCRVISGFERLRIGTRAAWQSARWNHAALVVNANGAIVEAGTGGVVLQHVEKYRDDDYHYVAVRATHDERSRAVRFAASRVGCSYSRRAVANLVVSGLTRKRVRLHDPDREMCGSLVANALTRAGENFERPPAEMLPADLATHYGLIPQRGRRRKEASG
jgi:hypothetical protein